MSRTSDDRILAEAYQTQKTKSMLIEQIISIVQDNPQTLLEFAWAPLLTGAMGALKGGGGILGALKGAAASPAGQELGKTALSAAGNWLGNLGGGAKPGEVAKPDTPANVPSPSSPLPNMGSGGIAPSAPSAAPAAAGGIMGQLKSILGNLDIGKLQQTLSQLQSMIQSV